MNRFKIAKEIKAIGSRGRLYEALAAKEVLK
jgi:hypothetical protein